MTIQCATCDTRLTIPAPAPAYCCTGCRSGGPCVCSYDAPASRVVVVSGPALEELRSRLGAMTMELATLAPDAAADAIDGIPRSDIALLRRRIAKLRDLIERVRVVEVPGVAMLGTRVLVHHADGVADALELVSPDDVDVRAGRISVESPLGRALVGRTRGERIEFEAPAGRRSITIADVR